MNGYWDSPELIYIRDQQWHQLYLDNSGDAGAFPAMAGYFQNGKMVLLTDPKVKPSIAGLGTRSHPEESARWLKGRKTAGKLGLSSGTQPTKL